MPRGDRSRSPDAAERISRTLAGFGRYPDKRPKGLTVDRNGSFKLENLMAAWGEKQGLTQKEVLNAIRKHMFHDGEGGAGTGALRFAIDSDVFGGITVKVLPKRLKGLPPAETREPPVESGDKAGGAGAPAACATPARTQWAERGRWGSNREPRAQQVTALRQIRGSVLQDIIPKKAPPKAGEPVKPAAAAPAPKLETEPKAEAPTLVVRIDKPSKLDMSLDEIMYDDRRTGEARGGGAAGAWTPPPLPKAASGQAQSMHERFRSGAAKDSQTLSERVQRWISWVLQAGHASVSVTVEEGGWARLDALSTAMRVNRPNLGEFDEAKLRALLEQTDEAGRWEIDAGRLRKVPKGARRCRFGAKAGAGSAPHTRRHSPPGATRDASSGASSSRSARRRDSASRSPSPAAEREDQALAEVCQNALRVSGDVTIVPASEAEAVEAEAAAQEVSAASQAEVASEARTAESTEPPRPPPPPGEGWTKYQDDGANWWYYEGPLGQFWCTEDSPEVRPYGEGPEEAAEP